MNTLRSIPLLNVVYIFGLSCVANTVKKVLFFFFFLFILLANEAQTGLMFDGDVGDSTGLMYDLIDYLNYNNISGLRIRIDFEKAFDSVDWIFMRKVLKSFGFGPLICWCMHFTTKCNQLSFLMGIFKIIKNLRGCHQSITQSDLDDVSG